jgi:hypothetical protein
MVANNITFISHSWGILCKVYPLTISTMPLELQRLKMQLENLKIVLEDAVTSNKSFDEQARITKQIVEIERLN